MMTEVGEIYAKSLITLDAYVPGGKIAAVLSKPDKYNPEPRWLLVFNLGGDWLGFLDSDVDEPERLCKWMPGAVEKAIEQMKIIFKDNEDVEADLEWFAKWANGARNTLFKADCDDLANTYNKYRSNPNAPTAADLTQEHAEAFADFLEEYAEDLCVYNGREDADTAIQIITGDYSIDEYRKMLSNTDEQVG